MILIREITPEELAALWAGSQAFAETLNHNSEHEELVITARIVLNTLQVKADVRPMTLPDAAPSSSRSYSANLDASRSSGSEETRV